MDPRDNLEEFGDPANYDLEEARHAQPRIDFCCDFIAASGGPVLELACGSGLVTLPLAARGLAVTGVDLARPMLEHARSKARQQGLGVEWVEGDARDVSLGRRFRVVYLTGNAFQAFLTRDDQERLLASARRHLVPGGVFLFETRNPSGHDLQDRDEETLDGAYMNVQGQRVIVSYRQRFDAPRQLMYWTMYRRWHDGRRDRARESRITCRFTWPQELVALLHDNGWSIERQFGNWDRSPLAANSEEIISICRPHDAEPQDRPARAAALGCA